MTDRSTIEDRLRIAGEEIPPMLRCPNCRRECAPFEIVDVRDTPDIPEDDACSTCLQDAIREMTAEQEAKSREENRDTWAGQDGEAVRARRDALLNQYSWTLRRGSPLTQNCQSEFEALFQALHRLTVDFDKPSLVDWPEIPTLEYGE